MAIKNAFTFPGAGAYTVDAPNTFVSGLAASSDGNTQGGQNQQVIRTKFVWRPRNDIKVILTLQL